MMEPRGPQEIVAKPDPAERTCGWMIERERRMAIEQIVGDGSDRPDKHRRSLELLRDVLEEVKAGKVFTPDGVLADWHRDDEQRRERKQ